MKIKLDKNDIVKTTKDALTLFRTGIKSKATRETYEKRLKEFLCVTLENYLKGDPKLIDQQKQFRLAEGNKKKIASILDADFEIRANEFVKKAKDYPDEITGVLLAYCTKLKERCEKPKTDPDYLNPNTVPNFFKPIKKLFKMNGVHFEWQQIDSSYPEQENNTETRGYTREEISQILNFTNPMETAVTHVASSSGIRRGGFDFTWDCIIPIYKKDNDLIMGNYNDTNDSDLICGMISVYKGSNEQYFALFTPEAWKSIKNYQTYWRSETLHEPKSKDPFLKRVGPSIIPLSPDALANRLNKVSKKSKIREPLTDGKRIHEVPIMNGFRRFFNKINKETFSRDSPLASLIKKEMMLSHTGLLKLDKNYFQTHWKELVEEYLQAVPALTISSEERVKAELGKVRKRNISLEDHEKTLSELQKQMKKQQQQFDYFMQQQDELKKK